MLILNARRAAEPLLLGVGPGAGPVGASGLGCLEPPTLCGDGIVGLGETCVGL